MPCNILCLGRCDRICVYTCQMRVGVRSCACALAHACVRAVSVCLSVYACVYMYYTYILQPPFEYVTVCLVCVC